MSEFDYDHGWDAQWDDMKKYGPMSRHVRRLIKQLIRPLTFETVLDVGCGQGSLLAELLDEFPHIKPCGADISQAALDLARRQVPSGQFWLLDIEKDSLNRKFDLVICSEVVEHILGDESAMRNMARMTGRYIVVTTVQGRMRRFEPQAVGHVRNYARGELAQKMESAGFSIKEVIEWGFPLYSPLYRNFLELTGSRGTTGKFGVARKLIATGLYYLFMVSSARRGDEIFLLAEPSARPAEGIDDA